jgi:hypothetical protein
MLAVASRKCESKQRRGEGIDPLVLKVEGLAFSLVTPGGRGRRLILSRLSLRPTMHL